MIKVLVIDDSAVARQVLAKELSRDASICVVGTAVDPYVAREKIQRLDPDVLTLDISMPRMDGLTFLKKLMKYHPLPVVVFSSLTPQGSETAMRALELGAVEVMFKDDGMGRGDVFKHVRMKIKAAAKADLSKLIPPAERETGAVGKGGKVAGKGGRTGKVTAVKPPMSPPLRIVAIGASTGGTEALRQLLTDYPPNGPGTLVVQHMPERFTDFFAKRLNELCAVEVKEARDGDQLHPGLVLIAPGNRHMVLHGTSLGYFVKIKDGPTVNHQKPSVDVLFDSVARCAGEEALGVLLTGMGTDGARGLKAMRDTGAVTIAQDESTSVVFGMPRAAIDIGAARHVLPLPDILARILTLASKAP